MPAPPVFGLDSPLAPPPPLTSFLGWRSRMMASFRSFFSRRQTDRTTLTFGSGVFLLKQLPQGIWWQPFYRGVLLKASRKAVCVRISQELGKLLTSTAAAVCDRRSSKHFLSAISV